jgi:CubicO group peptidase (beta-lactamase class C family)
MAQAMAVEHSFDLASVTADHGDDVCHDAAGPRAVALDSPVYTCRVSAGQRRTDTVRDLLTHRAGLYRWKPVLSPPTRRVSTPTCATCRSSQRHEGRHYSDLGFMLAGYIVERVSGKPLDTFLADELYGPLALAHTGFRRGGMGPAGPIAATSHGNPYEYRMVADDNFGYLCDEDPAAFTGWRKYTLQGEVNDGNSWYGHGGVAGHAGLFSSARELNVLLQVLLADGMYGGRRIVSPETVGTFLTPDAFTGNGVGWAISTSDAAPAMQTFSHGGFTGTYVAGVPELGLAIVFCPTARTSGRIRRGTT